MPDALDLGESDSICLPASPLANAYGRTLAMVRAGLTYVFVHWTMRPDLLDRFNALQSAEREAREKRDGLWRDWLLNP